VLVGLAWTTSALLGVALAPTDPAVVFSVVGGGNGLADRPKTILEAESGANDPIAIALMVAVIASATDGGAWLPTVRHGSGSRAGHRAGRGNRRCMIHARAATTPDEPRETLPPIVALSAAGFIFGIAAALDGSGFLAVFVAGLILSDADVQVGADVRAFHAELATLAEVIVFVALGLTVHLAAVGASGLLDGLVLTVVLLTVARVPAVVALLAPFSIPVGERLFLAWAGLRGAVPILLASLALVAGVSDAHKVYGLVFIVVAASVLIQGMTLPAVATLLGIDDPKPVGSDRVGP
jgi:cell volume regulation protein A